MRQWVFTTRDGDEERWVVFRLVLWGRFFACLKTLSTSRCSRHLKGIVIIISHTFSQTYCQHSDPIHSPFLLPICQASWVAQNFRKRHKFKTSSQIQAKVTIAIPSAPPYPKLMKSEPHNSQRKSPAKRIILLFLPYSCDCKQLVLVDACVSA